MIIASSAFPVEVPDFLNLPAALLLPRYAPDAWDAARKRGRNGCRNLSAYTLTALRRLRFWQGRASLAVVPDELLAAAYYGAGPLPDNWRRTLGCAARAPNWLPECPPLCPFHGQQRGPHLHNHCDYAAHPSALNALLDPDVAPAKPGTPAAPVPLDPDHAVEVPARRNYDGTPRDAYDKPARYTTALRLAQREGEIYPVVYLPTLFGYSPRVGWTRMQVRLVVGLTRELSREPKPTLGPDGVRARQPTVVHGTERRWLRTGKTYAAFDGNFPGQRGYGLFAGRSGWLHRAGYELSQEDTPQANALRWKAAHYFLDDLQALSGPLQLTVCAVARDGAYKPLTALIDSVWPRNAPSAAAREWLYRSRLHVLAPVDFVARWRALFASRMGFNSIPTHRG